MTAPAPAAATAAPPIQPDVLQINGRELHCVLLIDVQDAARARSELLSPTQPDMSLINASMVAGTFHLQVAAFKALEAEAEGRLDCRTLHAQLVYSLAGTKQVVASLKRCGMHDDTQHVLLAMFDPAPDKLQEVCQSIQGTPMPLSQLAELLQPKAIQQAYKVTKEELQIGSLEDAVVAKLAGRDC